MDIHFYRSCLLFSLFLVACAARLDYWPSLNALDSRVLEGDRFSHRVWEKGAGIESDWLNVYLHGDGEPWLGRDKIAIDPTGVHRVEAMLWYQERAQAYMLGRPCYFAVADIECSPLYWTSGRYSPEVVASLSAVVEHLHNTHPAKKIRLIGYSGGGTLAVLVANHLSFVDVVVTFAAPLDLDAWLHAHEYDPLTQSVNPAAITLRSTLKQFHYLGAKDRNVTLEMNRRFYQKNNVVPDIVDAADHSCCWQEVDVNKSL